MPSKIELIKPLELSEVLEFFTPAELEQLLTFEAALAQARQAMAERRARQAQEVFK